MKRDKNPNTAKSPLRGDLGGPLFLILLFIGLTSCTPKVFKGMQSSSKKEISKNDLYPVFNSDDATRMFNMEINFKENSFSGILIVKPIGENSTRAVFTTVFGMTVFDFEFNETDFKVNRCIEPMQKKVVLSIFKKDFRTLFMYNIPSSMKAKVYQAENSSMLGYKAKTKDKKSYFLINNNDKQLLKTEVPGCIALLRIDYQNYENNFPEKILISHPKIKLNMQLEKIEK